MPLIELQNPWEQAAGFATDYVKSRQDTADRNQKQSDDAATTASAAEAERYKRGRDALTDKLAQNKDQREQLTAQADVTSKTTENQIALEKQKLAQQMEPLEVKLKTAQLGVAQGTLDKDKAEMAYKAAQTALENTKTKLEAKYGAQKAQAIVSEAAARIEQAHASAARSYAGAAHENAETAGVQRKLATGGFDYHPGAGGRGGNRAPKFEVGAAVGQLSPKARQMYDMMYSTNNPPTPQEAVLAIRNPRNGLTDADRAALQTILTQKNAALQTPAMESGAARTAATGARQAAGDATQEGSRQFRAITSKNKAYLGLRPNLRGLLEHMMVEQHGTPEQIQAELAPIAAGTATQDGISKDDAAAMLRSLGGQ